ncbi:MAG: WYL domain-containing protein [Sphingobacteriales bacterium JAD_PAG50586_3]|nr:MAG: WYL domain-containing protein [Sphingobacteriales bacterium JAD_PAG50586_3]
MGTLNEVVEILKQFKGFGYFDELTGMISRLEDKVQSTKNKGRTYIDFEKNELLKGINLIEPLHKAIIKQQTLQVSYQSFKAEKPVDMVIYPYILKEYRNRWFLLGLNRKGKVLQNMALDRIVDIKELTLEPFVKNTIIDTRTYFNDCIGVTKMPGQLPSTIVLKVDNRTVPYILTKPLHSSQKVLKQEDDGLIFSIEVIWNFELEREILGFGESIRVLAPRRLQSKIKSRMRHALNAYDTAQEKFKGQDYNNPIEN